MSKKKFNAKKHSKNNNISPAGSSEAVELKKNPAAEPSENAANAKEAPAAEPSENAANAKEAQAAGPSENAADAKEAQAAEPSENAADAKEAQAAQPSENAADAKEAQAAQASENAANANEVQAAQASENAADALNAEAGDNAAEVDSPVEEKKSVKSSDSGTSKKKKKKKHKDSDNNKKASKKESKSSGSAQFVSVSLIIIVFIGLVSIFIYNYFNNGEQEPVSKEMPVASVSSPAESPSPSPSPSAEPTQEPSPEATPSAQPGPKKVRPEERPSLILNKVSDFLTDKQKYIELGKYPQNSGGTPEPIEWLVLAKDDESQLVISRYALDCKQFNSEFTDISWNDCELRQWLNKDFFNSAFSFSEKNKILTSKINIDINDATKQQCEDKIFCLSVIEARKLFDSDQKRACEPTEYAMSHNAYKDPDTGFCVYWLRSPGLSANGAAVILSDGQLWSDGHAVHETDHAVRPAMRIRL